MSFVFACALCAGVFAEEFDVAKYRELTAAANAARKEGNRTDYLKFSKEAKTYIETSELSKTDPNALSVQLAVKIPMQFVAAKVIPTKAQIDAKVEERFTLFDETGTLKNNLKSTLYYRYKLPEALVALEKAVPNDGKYAVRAIGLYINKGKYAEAIKLCDEYPQNTAGNRFTIYERQKDNEKIWALGKSLFLDTYVPNANTAMRYIKSMFNRKPASVKDEEIVELLTKIGEKYPTPGTDFETWKGFMGFVGYKYKTITGKDLFKQETASK